MNIVHKLLFSLIAGAFIAAGAMTISNETHTGSTKYSGVVTLVGPAAVSFGWVVIVLGLLPLFVWLPRKAVVPYLCAWFVAVMAAVFVPLFMR